MNKNLFTQIPIKSVQKNSFDLSHDVKMSMKMGVLTPVLAMDCIPGDNFSIGAECLIRFAPLLAPVMHRFEATIHYFFVPNRIMWPNWEDYIVNPNTQLVHPFVTIDSMIYGISPILDYMGIPTPIPGNTERINPMPLAAFQAIYNEYYRDQNLIPETIWKLTDGDNTTNGELFTTRRRAWEHDYFTSSLPFAQKGNAVGIPLGDVVLKGNPDGTTHFQQSAFRVAIPQAPQTGNINIIAGQAGVAGSNIPVQFDPQGGLTVAPTTITDLRRAFKLQEFLEKAARAGTRYVEHLKAFFNVSAQDSRLQRPEYITGVKTPIIISEVLNTTGFEIPQGNMAGHGVGIVSGGQKGYYCQEHGWIIGIMSVLPKPAYQQGIERQFLKLNDPMEYFFPEFAHIGEQEVYNREIYAFQGATGGDTFGYVPRYSEYKYKPSRVAGDFKTNLDYWHDGRIFATPPALNQQFIECTPDERIFNVIDPTEDKLYVQVYNKIRAYRPMPYFGSPRL
jgi:hypothetical protein